LNRSFFYDQRKVAILPMGFCYPGAAANGGDKPPHPECAPPWHGRVLDHLPNLQLTLLVGQYSQKRYLGSGRKSSMTETVKAFPESSEVLSTSTSELAKRSLDAKTTLVRTGGYTSAQVGCAARNQGMRRSRAAVCAQRGRGRINSGLRLRKPRVPSLWSR
jgi:hypothetical protein